MQTARSILQIGMAFGAILFLYSPVCPAKIPEPSNIFFGTVSINNKPVKATDTGVLVTIKIGNSVIDTYRMGDRAAIGDRYYLEVPMDAEGERVPNTARTGDTATVFIKGMQAGTMTIGSRGKVTQSNLAVTSVDTDGDGMPDTYETAYGLKPFDPSDATADPDGDKLTNLQEFALGTNPNRWDTDGDGMSDAFEAKYDSALNALDASDASGDADRDGFTNLEEAKAMSDPTVKNAVQKLRVEIIKAISGHGGSIADLKIDGGRVITASQHESAIRFWNIKTGQAIRESDTQSANGVNALATDDRWVLAGTGDADVKQFDSATGTLTRTLSNTRGSILTVSIFDGSILAGSADGSVHVWDIATGALLKSWQAYEKHFISGLSASPNGLYTVGTFPWKSLKIWDLETEENRLTITGARICCRLTDIHLVGKKLYITGLDSTNTIKVIDLNDLSSRNLTGHLDSVASLAAADHRFFSGGEDGTINIWSLTTGNLIQSFKAHPDAITSIAANDTHLVTGSIVGSVKIWSLIGSSLDDTDKDGMPDGWETANGLNPRDNSDQNLDPDQDGLVNNDEYINQTDPYRKDTDNDQMPDKWELNNSFNPRDATDAGQDADGDGATNLQEFQKGTNPRVPDAGATPAGTSA